MEYQKLVNEEDKDTEAEREEEEDDYVDVVVNTRNRKDSHQPDSWGKCVVFCLIILALLLFIFEFSTFYKGQFKLPFIEKKVVVKGEQQFVPKSTPPSFAVRPFGSHVEELWYDYFGGKPNGSKRFDCNKFIDNDATYLKTYNKTGRYIIKTGTELNISMTCPSIRRRIMGNNTYSRLPHSIAFSRTVFQAYAMQEAFIAFSYNPYNSYCFAISSNSSREFVDSMKQLQRCFPNVFVYNETFPFDSAGHYQDIAHYSCLKTLLEDKQWKHVLMMQNDDMIQMTPEELSKISQIMDRASGVNIEGPQSYRYDSKDAWTAENLHLWKNESGKTDEQLHKNMTVTKSLNEAFLAREFVEAIFDQFDVHGILEKFNSKKYYGVDEMMTSTIFSNGWLGVTGQLRARCDNYYFVRNTHWNWSGSSAGDLLCKSHSRRHGICILGVEYLKEMTESDKILGNKVRPDFDLGTVMCYGEYLHDLQTGKRKRELRRKTYENTPQVRELKEIKEKGDKYNPKEFKCKL